MKKAKHWLKMSDTVRNCKQFADISNRRPYAENLKSGDTQKYQGQGPQLYHSYIFTTFSQIDWPYLFFCSKRHGQPLKFEIPIIQNSCFFLSCDFIYAYIHGNVWKARISSFHAWNRMKFSRSYGSMNGSIMNWDPNNSVNSNFQKFIVQSKRFFWDDS